MPTHPPTRPHSVEVHVCVVAQPPSPENTTPTDDTGPLLQALEDGQFDTVFDLLLPPSINPTQTSGPDLPPAADPPLRIGPDQLTPLHYACQHGRLDVIEKLVSEYQYELNELGMAMPTPLQVAAACGQTDVVQYIITNSSDVSLKGGVVSPLHLAADNGHLDTLKALVKSKLCRVSIGDQDGNTPLHHACAHGHLQVVSYLCDKARHPLSIRNKKGESPLHIAAKHCHFAIVKYLIDEKHCDPAAKNERVGSTPLHLAAKSGCLEIVQYLANEKTCNIESKTYSKSRKRAVSITSGKTPLHYACFGGHKAVVEYLVKEQICNPRSTDDEGLTPFHLACQEGHLKIVEFFLGLNMEEFNDVSTEDGRTLLHCAALSGNMEVVRRLIQSTSCDLSTVDAEGRTAVHYAARNGCTSMVQMLVEEYKCNINAVDQTGAMPLHLAAKCGHLETVKYLFSNPLTNAACTEEHGFTPLHLAAYKGRVGVVSYILSEKLISIMCKDKTGRTPLHHAAQTGSLEMVQLLANHPDCDPTCQDKGLKATPLHMAAGSGHLDMVRYLVEEKNANPSSTDKFNSTPMHRAAASGHLDIARFLVEEKQCNPISKNKFGNSPLHLACQKGQLEMVRLLLSYSKENATGRNQVGRMPLDLVNNSEILGEFLRLGVDPSKSSITGRFPYLKEWSAVSPVVKIFIMGDAGVGKTTLVKALQGEGFVTEWLSGRFHRIGSANGETVGINVTTFESRHFGKVILYDLSGHHGYYAGHSAILNLGCRDSHPIFITVVDLRKSPEEIEHSVSYWSRLVKMSLPEETPGCCGILLGNHENELSKDGYRHKPALLEKVTQAQSEILHYKGWLTIDARRVASTNMHKLRQLLSQTCEVVRGNFKPSYECSLLRSFILHKFQSPIVMEFRDLHEYISHSTIPCIKEQEVLLRTCHALHSRGYLLFLFDHNTPENSWIILNQVAVLSMIHGFQKHIDLTNKVGLLPISQLEVTLGAMGFNLTLVIQYFLRIHLCLRVVDRRVLYSIVGFNPPSPLEDHLFFPHLITGDVPPAIWSHDESWGRYFGWTMECCGTGCFFPPRFLQMVLLRMAAMFPFNTNPNSPFITRRQLTHIWREGMSWLDTRGIQVLVTLERDSTAVLVLTRCKREGTCEMDYYQLRSLVLREVRLTQEAVCPHAQVRENVLLPSSTTRYPFPPADHTPLKACRMEDITRALLTPDTQLIEDIHILFCTESSQLDTPPDQLTINNLLGFEVYNFLEPDLLKEMFSKERTRGLCVQDLDTIGSALARSNLDMRSLARILQVTPTMSASSKSDNTISVLSKWASKESCRTVADLREAFDRYSVFAGLNILVSMY